MMTVERLHEDTHAAMELRRANAELEQMQVQAEKQKKEALLWKAVQGD